ncbi:SDR family oxidoreductase, partial [Streptococcus pneumoniae]|nr:SDR family oxidoreductase [Streptococcus pneumoniae]
RRSKTSLVADSTSELLRKFAWVASETPIKRWIEPEEIAELSLFLASGKASAMQGQILTIDGGWSLK